MVAEELSDPRVVAMYAAQSPQELRLPAAFFTGSGWQADAPYYCGAFDPKKGWKNKSKGELMLRFDDMPKCVKVTLRSLLDFNFSVVALTQVCVSETSDNEDDQPIDSSDEEQLVSDLRQPRGAAQQAREKMGELSPAGSNSSSSVWSPVRRTTDSSSDSSPLAEQRTQPPASAAPTPVPLRRSPRQASPAAAGGGGAAAAAAEAVNDSSDEETERLAEERIAYGTKVVVATKDKHQPVRSLEWTLTDPSKLTEDVRDEYPGTFGAKYPAALLNVKEPSRKLSVYELWKHMLPETWLARYVETANKKLTLDAVDPNYRKTCVAEIEAVLGLALAASVHGSGPFDSYFGTGYDESGLFQSPGFGRHGVNKNRSLILLRAMHLSHGPDQPGDDPHWFIDGPLAEFNAHMAASVRPSWLGTMDESGNVWHGAEGEGDYNKCPHITVVKRKPEPIVGEFNDACCALSEIMMMVEFEKAAKYHSTSENFNHTGSYNAAMTTRLSSPWAKKNAAVYGDSRFGSVKAAYFNKKLHNVHSLFDIKTGTALFPRKELMRLCAKEHGSIVVLTTSITEGLAGRTLNLFAIAQRRGPAVHTFLATFGTFNLEIPARFPKITRLADAPYTTPAVLNIVTTAQPGIDKFNRTAFDVLGMHDTFITQCYETRFTQHFMMPITYVNAVNAAKYFNAARYHKSTPQKFILLELAGKMVRNDEWLKLITKPKDGPPGGASCSTRTGTNYGQNTSRVSINGGPPSRESPCKHTLILLHQIEGYKGGKQQRCHECDVPVSWACARCSTKDKIVALHPPIAQGSKIHYGCLAAHRRNPLGGGYKETHENITGTSKAAKRRRKLDLVHL